MARAMGAEDTQRSGQRSPAPTDLLAERAASSTGPAAAPAVPLRLAKSDMGAILIHPPTPERVESPADEPDDLIDGDLIVRAALAAEGEIVVDVMAAPTVAVPIEATPVVAASTSGPSLTQTSSPPQAAAGGSTSPTAAGARSPPRRTIAGAADSLQLVGRRGRRPRLFAFADAVDSTPTSSPDRAAIEAGRSASHSGTSSLPRRPGIMARKPSVDAQLHPATVLVAPKRRENGLKLNLDGIIPTTTIDPADAIVKSPYSGLLIRKKSGEIVKPALKYLGPLRPNGTPIQEEPDRPLRLGEARSCPSTPSIGKSVQFDAQLERIKLFLADQKPQVVSRAGSPTIDTTSDGDEYPFPSTDEERGGTGEGARRLGIRLVNFPSAAARDAAANAGADLWLDSLSLDDERKSLRGHVIVRNIAFQKWVAVRFTFDWWQTTSEVTATHVDSVRGGTHDRFAFTIKLQDLLARIEDKTLFLAIRYDTDGREIWDSNGGLNYQVAFEKTQLVPSSAPVSRIMPRRAVSSMGGAPARPSARVASWQVGGLEPDRIADLRARLTSLEAEHDDDERPPSPMRVGASPSKRYSALAASGSAGSPLTSPRRSLPGDTSSDLPAAGQGLAARYDFGSALRSSRRLSPNRPAVELPDVQTGLLYPKQQIQRSHAANEFYSPRAAALALSPDNVFTTPLSPLALSPTHQPLSPQPQASPTPVSAALPVQLPPSSAPAMSVAAPLQVSTPLPLSDSPQRLEDASTAPLTQPATASSPFRADLSPSSSTTVSPPMLEKSGSVSDTTPSDSPELSPALPVAPWEAPKRDPNEFRRAVELLCWAESPHDKPYAPPTLSDRRSHSTSSLDNFFVNGFTTPRAMATPPVAASVGLGSGMYAHGAIPRTPPSATSSPGSFYTPRSYASTPARSEDLDHVERAVDVDADAAVRSLASSLASTPMEGSPIQGLRSRPHSVVC